VLQVPQLERSAFPARFPERTHPEPSEGERASDGDGDAAETGAACVIFLVLPESGTREAQCHDEKEKSSDLQPKLVRSASERPAGGASSTHYGIDRAVAPGLLADNPRGNPHLS
jgi:hypothetical protein